jgi:hypothetical protein
MGEHPPSIYLHDATVFRSFLLPPPPPLKIPLGPLKWPCQPTGGSAPDMTFGIIYINTTQHLASEIKGTVSQDCS